MDDLTQEEIDNMIGLMERGHKFILWEKDKSTKSVTLKLNRDNMSFLCRFEGKHSDNKSIHLPVADLTDMYTSSHQDYFSKFPIEDNSLCFSLVSSSIVLDLQAVSPQDLSIWLWGVYYLTESGPNDNKTAFSEAEPQLSSSVTGSSDSVSALESLLRGLKVTVHSAGVSPKRCNIYLTTNLGPADDFAAIAKKIHNKSNSNLELSLEWSTQDANQTQKRNVLSVTAIREVLIGVPEHEATGAPQSLQRLVTGAEKRRCTLVNQQGVCVCV